MQIFSLKISHKFLTIFKSQNLVHNKLLCNFEHRNKNKTQLKLNIMDTTLTTIEVINSNINITDTAASQMQKAAEKNVNTLAAINTDNKKFVEYCDAIGNIPGPVALLEYLLNLSATCKISTLRRKFATLSQLYPVDDKQRKAINLALRKLSAAQNKESNRARKGETNINGTVAKDFSTKQAAAVSSIELQRIISDIDGTTNKGQRNITMFLTAFYGGLRGSELLNIRKSCIKTTDAGNVEIELMDTKTASNAKVYIYNRKTIAQLKKYINMVSNIDTDYLFTKIDKHNNITINPLTRQSWHRIVKQTAPNLQTHSFRRGAITQIIKNGCDMVSGMQFSRHVSKSSFLRYLDTATNEDSNGGKYL